MFATKTDLISYELEPTFGEYFNDYDIDSFIDEAYTFDYPGGYEQREDVDFWEIAQKHDISGK